MTPVVVGLLVIGAGLGALLFMQEGKPQKTTVIDGRKYKVWWEGDKKYKIVREYQGEDVISLTATKDSISIYLSAMLHTNAELARELREQMARDIRGHWEELGLPPQMHFELPGDKPKEYSQYA